MIVGAFDGSFPFGLATSAMRQQHMHMHTQQAPQPTAVPRAMRCGYPSKICMNERAWKRDGSLHRFCEEHRKRANQNQKRWAQRKAKAKADKGGALGDVPANDFLVDESMLQAKDTMDFPHFDLTLDALLTDASFWSPTASGVHKTQPAQWESTQDDEALEAELWAALGLGNVNISL